ncbi:MAG TPA: hypothetical protein VGJ05_07520 [Fimbriiglobus sp.]
MTIPWWGYVIGAGLAWGTYVPLVFFGGSVLSQVNAAGAPIGMGGRLASILCVGVAYFLLAVVVPVVLMAVRDDATPQWKTTGLVFSALAGVAGAIGAICVIFASKAAMAAGAEVKKLNPDFDVSSYRILIAPMIFSLAPIINTLVSFVWHPKAGEPLRFVMPEMPGWKLLAGILLVAVGTFLVLYSKEETEASKRGVKPAPAPAVEPAKAT